MSRLRCLLCRVTFLHAADYLAHRCNHPPD